MTMLSLFVLLLASSITIVPLAVAAIGDYTTRFAAFSKGRQEFNQLFDESENLGPVVKMAPYKWDHVMFVDKAKEGGEPVGAVVVVKVKRTELFGWPAHPFLKVTKMVVKKGLTENHEEFAQYMLRKLEEDFNEAHSGSSEVLGIYAEMENDEDDGLLGKVFGNLKYERLLPNKREAAQPPTNSDNGGKVVFFKKGIPRPRFFTPRKHHRGVTDTTMDARDTGRLEFTSMYQAEYRYDKLGDTYRLRIEAYDPCLHESSDGVLVGYVEGKNANFPDSQSPFFKVTKVSFVSGRSSSFFDVRAASTFERGVRDGLEALLLEHHPEVEGIFHEVEPDSLDPRATALGIFPEILAEEIVAAYRKLGFSQLGEVSPDGVTTMYKDFKKGGGGGGKE